MLSSFSSFGHRPQPGAPQQLPPSSLYPQLPGVPNQSQPPQPNQLQPWQVQQLPYASTSANTQPFLPGNQQLQPYGQPQQQQPSSTMQPYGQAGQPYQRPPYGYAAPAPSTALAPQPLESVSKDEDPVYGPLGRARGKVQRGLTGDDEISPDLADMLSAPNNEPYTPIPTTSHSFKPLRLTKSTPLPDALHRELNYKHLTAKMGLFEEIERAWFTVDNKLFLWDYTDGVDFNRYDEQADTIVAVGLVKARKEVLIDEITHVLIVCTNTRATLLGLSRPSARELNLYQTNLAVDLPTQMVNIAGTNSGRVFMSGINKDLYELSYSNDSSAWFKAVQVWSVRAGVLGRIMPSFLAGSSKEGIESFVVDPIQNKLFALHTRGEIELFDVSGSNCESKGRYTNLRNDLINRGLAGAAPQYPGAAVVSIHVVGGHESRRVSLVAVTANGSRAYFTTTNFGSTPLSPSYFRAPPAASLNLAPQTLYSSGTLVGVQHDTSTAQPTTQLQLVVLNPGRQSSARENFDTFEAPVLQEWYTNETVPSQVWTVVEIPSTAPAASPPSLRRSDGLALTPLARQATVEARQFLILATSGLYFVTQPRPIDMLSADLELEKDSAIAATRLIFGKTQLAAMGILLGASADLSQPDVASAVNTILLSAGAPVVRDGTAGRSIVYSGRHEGLALTLSRLLRPIWNVKVTAPLFGAPGRLGLGVPEYQLLAVQGRLEQLKRYLDEHPFPRHQAEGDAKVAWDQEELSLHGLSVLLKQAIEAISFVLLLSDYKISDIIARCELALQNTLANLTYQGLLTTTDGRDVAKKLVTALIEQQIGQELGIDALSELLQQRCGTFCQPGDVVMYKAEESMRRAESSRDPYERKEYLAESLRLFSRAAGSIGTARLKEIAKRFEAQQDSLGSIQLALEVADKVDPLGKAADYVADGRHPADPRKAFYQARMECYECVTLTLEDLGDALDQATASGNPGPAIQKRDDAYALAINSDDRLFHFYLYDWHVARGLQEQLLDFDTPYIEDFLRLTSSDLPDRRDLLWKYFARREEYLPAAQALYELATRPSDLPLADRAYYLAQALTSAKSSASLGADDVELVSTLQERMEVVNVQMEVMRGIEVHGELSRQEKEETLRRLDTTLLSLDELYQNFARPFRLYECILLILKTAETRLEDVCEAVWRILLQEQPGDMKGELVTELCRRFFPSEGAPLDIVLPVVFSEAAAVRSVSSVGWASQSLLDGGVGLRDVWEMVSALAEQGEDDEEREFYAEEAGVLIKRWVEERDAIPAAEVEKVASAYLLRTQGQQMDDRRMATRERMSEGKRAVARY